VPKNQPERKTNNFLVHLS